MLAHAGTPTIGNQSGRSINGLSAGSREEGGHLPTIGQHSPDFTPAAPLVPHVSAAPSSAPASPTPQILLFWHNKKNP